MNCSKKESEFHFLPQLTNNFGKFLDFHVFSGHNVCQFQFLSHDCPTLILQLIVCDIRFQLILTIEKQH